MTGTDYSAVERELEKAGYFTDATRGRTVSDSVLALFAVLDGRGLDLDDRNTVTQLFASLVQTDSNLGNSATYRSSWQQFYLGSFEYGCTVRVKIDAYATGAGRRHNGLTGTFIAARGGRAYVEYHGRKTAMGHEHSPTNLEVLVKT